jgi:hypothetical protein
MKHKIYCAMLSCVMACATAYAQTAGEIIAKHLAARGGLEKIKAVQTERVSGHISFGVGTEGPFIVESKRPMKMHMEIVLQGKSLVRGFDGKTGWQINPFAPQTGPQPMTAEDSANIAKEADFDGPMVDSQAKGVHIELAGKEDVDGKPAWKIKVTLSDGTVDYYFIDQASYLVTQWQGERTAQGKPVTYISKFSDFRKVGALTFPFAVESTSAGSDVKQQITTDKIELDVPLGDSLFIMPAPTPAPTTPAAPKQ